MNHIRLYVTRVPIVFFQNQSLQNCDDSRMKATGDGRYSAMTPVTPSNSPCRGRISLFLRSNVTGSPPTGGVRGGHRPLVE